MTGRNLNPVTAGGEIEPTRRVLAQQVVELVPGITRGMANRVAREVCQVYATDRLEHALVAARLRLARKTGGSL